MSVELISVLIAMLAVGATLGGLILTATRGLMTACHRRREMSTIVVTIVLSLMGLSSCGEAEETTSRSTATSEEELAAQLGTDTEPVDAEPGSEWQEIVQASSEAQEIEDKIVLWAHR